MQSEPQTGWERSRRTHFNEIVATYDRVRPGYPVELFRDILTYTEMQIGHPSRTSRVGTPEDHPTRTSRAGTPVGRTAIEIGAGTGKATKPFLEAGFTVTAVEINNNMADFLVERYGDYDGLSVVNTAFEDTELLENSYDLVYAANSFHWVDPDISCPLVYRLLKSGGTFALFRYNTIPAEGEDLYEEIQAAYTKHYYSYYTSGIRPKKLQRETYWEAAELIRGFRIDSLENYGFCDIFRQLYDVTRLFDASEYIDYLETMSDHRALPKANREALYDGIREAIIRHGGYHKIDYLYQLYMGRK